MANIGTVQSVTGVVKAIAADGTERILSVGDTVAENEQIITGNGTIVIAFNDGTVMDLGSNSSIVLNDDLLNQEKGEQTAQSRDAAEDEVAALQEALADPNFDPTAALPATAAGPTAAGATGENNGHTIVSVDYLDPRAPVTSGHDTVGINVEFEDPELELPPVNSPPEADDVLTEANRGDELPEGLRSALRDLGLGGNGGGEALGGNVRVGYYDMSDGQGDANQVAGIVANGYTAINIFDLSAEELAGIDILVVQNPSNGGYGAEYLANLALIQEAVSNGLILVIAGDRYVDGAESILPGGDGFDILRDFADSKDIDILNPDTILVTSDTADTSDDVTNTSLDGGNHSTHGFAVADSLGDAELLLSTSDGSEVVVFSYQFGSGSVIYSTIPIDYYLNGSGPADTQEGMEQYYENLIEYAASIGGNVDVAFYKQLTVDGIIGDSDFSVADFGGSDAETSLENLVFTLTSDPSPIGSLLLVTEGGDTSFLSVGDTFTSADTVWWYAMEDDVAAFSEENEIYNLPNVNFDYSVTDEDGESADATVTIQFPLVTPEPLVVLGEDQEGPVIIDEDSSGVVTVDADTNPGSHLTTIVITGFEDYVTADWLDLSSLEVLGATTVFDEGTGTLTISGLSGTTYSGSFEIIPAEDDDRDAGTLTATATAVNNVDPSLTVDAVDTADVITDAILDDSIDVTSIDVNENESDAEETYGLGLDGSAINPFTGSGGGGQDTDGSESGTVTLSLDAPLVDGASIALSEAYTLGAGTVILTDNGDDTYTLSGWSNTADLAAAIDALEVTVPAGFDGDIEGTIAWSFEDTTSDTEDDLTDNADSGSTDFSVSVTGGVGTPNVGLTVNGDGYFKEDTANDVTLSASTADATDELTTLVVEGLSGWTVDGADITALEALADVDTAVFAAGTLTITFNDGVTSFNYGTLTLTPPEDTDADSPLTVTANVQDQTDNSLTTNAQATPTLVVDAVVDSITNFTVTVNDALDDADTSFEIGESGTVNVTADFGDSSDNSETHEVAITIPDGFSVSDYGSGTLNGNTLTYSVTGGALDVTFTLTNDSAEDGTVQLSATASALDEATVAQSPTNPNGSGVEHDETDNYVEQIINVDVDVLTPVTEFPGGLAYTIAGKGNTGAFLYSIDLESGIATELGPVIVDGEDKLVFTGLAMSPTTDTLFGFGSQGGSQYIAEINPVNGEVLDFVDVSATLSGSALTGAAFGADGTYYVIQDNVVYEFTGTGLTQLFSISGGHQIDGFSIDPTTGDMYFAINNGSNTDLYVLLSGDIPDTDIAVAITLIAQVYGTLPDDTPDNPDDNPVGAASIDSLAFDNYGNLWGADNDGTLIKIDPVDASIQGGTTLANNEVTGSGVYSLGIGITEDQTFVGGAGDDIITGGSGSDILTGNGGDDLFVWTSSDDIDVDGTPADGIAVDTVTDFRDDGLADLDALDLSDLLIGEESGDITDYIEVQVDGADIVLSVTTDPDNNSDVTQTIVLEDTTTTQLGINTYDLGTVQGQTDALNALISNGSIQVDS